MRTSDIEAMRDVKDELQSIPIKGLTEQEMKKIGIENACESVNNWYKNRQLPRLIKFLFGKSLARKGATKTCLLYIQLCNAEGKKIWKYALEHVPHVEIKPPSAGE